MLERERVALGLVRQLLDAEPQQVDPLLQARCGDDAELRARVESLLRHARQFEYESLSGSQTDATRQELPADVLIGSKLGAFRVVARIGRGGMGVVYRGERDAADFEQTVALKLIRRGFDFDDVHARFLRERRILARLNHPNIAHFIDGGVAADGRPWFALEFVKGESITRWCDARRLDVRERVRLFLEACAAVQYAHTQLIVHRDLKPGNILVDEDGAVRLLDFGIARMVGGDGDGDVAPTLTMANANHALTPEYAAPEQFTGSAVGVGADVYALGVILYELVAGVGPYPVSRHDMRAAERSVRDVPAESLTSAPWRLQPGAEPSTSQTTARKRVALRSTTTSSYRAMVRGDFSRIVQTALAKEPERRYSTVAAFSADLSRWLRGAPVQVSGNAFGYRLGKFVRRNGVAVAVATTLAVGLITTSVLAVRSASLARQQREVAVAEAARATAVRDYVQLMFRNAAEQPDAGKATARDALTRSAEQIFVQFKDQPELGQATALSLSELYMQLGDANGGTALLERLLAWPGIENNPDVLAIARYNLAQLEYARGDKTRARELLDKAQAWWASEPARHRDMLMESRTAQAQIERAEGHVEQAITTLEAAIVERGNARPVKTREVASALNALSLALADVGRDEEAMQRAGEGYELLANDGLATDVTALALLNNRANALVTMGRPDSAVVDFRRVADARRALYGRSPELASSQANLGIALVAQAKMLQGDARRAPLDEAIALLEDAYAMAIEGSGDRGRSATSIRFNLAEVYVLAGDYTRAQPLAEDAVRIGSEQFGTTSLLTGLGFRARARVRAAQGNLDGAREDVEEARRIFTQLGKGAQRHLDSLDTVLDASPRD